MRLNCWMDTCCVDCYVLASVAGIVHGSLCHLLVVFTGNVTSGGIVPRERRIGALIVEVLPESRTGGIGQRRVVVAVLRLLTRQSCSVISIDRVKFFLSKFVKFVRNCHFFFVKILFKKSISIFCQFFVNFVKNPFFWSKFC